MIKNGRADVRRTSAHVRTRPHQKSVIRTHPHAHFQSTFRTRVHKNRRTRTCARAGARTHTKGLFISFTKLNFRRSFQVLKKYKS